MRRGVRVAIDVGTARIGVAASDIDGRMAVPVETVARGGGDLDRLAELIDERDAVEVVVGWPVRLDGSDGPATTHVQAFADRLIERIAPLPVRAVDERLTTAAAQRALSDAGRSVRDSRAFIDQQAAVGILETALSVERASGVPAGRLLSGASPAPTDEVSRP
jgi:putative Holliday junction resolvase